jgi:hypothetical protein
VAKNQPAAYVKVAALLVPREMKVEHSSWVKGLTDEQLEAAINAVQELLDARAKGIDAKLVEGEVVEPAALPAPRRPQRKVRDKRMVPITSDDTRT